jgi:hypothetical protein
VSHDAARMGISGRLASAFVANPLTPVLAIAGLLLGLVAVLITPREEEPQIDVTMANVIVPFAGAPRAMSRTAGYRRWSRCCPRSRA